MIHRWWQLGIRNWRARFTRTLAESVAVVVACALVVLLTTALASAERTLWRWNDRWVGKVDLQVLPAAGQYFQPADIDIIAGVEGVAEAATRLEAPVQLLPPGIPTGGPSVTLRGLQLPAGPRLRPLEILEGRPLADPDARECLLEKATAERFGIAVGETVKLKDWDASSEFEVVGIIASPPLFRWLTSETVRVPLAQAQRLIQKPGKSDAALLRLADGADQDAVCRRIRAALPGDFGFLRSADRTSMIRENLRLWRAGLYVMCGLLLVVAMLLVFATLRCDATRRIGELGTLRCLGASRRQVTAVMLVEAVPIAVWGVLLGVPAGLLAARAVVAGWPQWFAQGLAPSGWGVAVAVAGAAVATGGGALLPALAAGRVSPIQAQRPSGRSGRWVVIPVAAVLAAALAVVPMALLHAITDPQVALYVHVSVALPLMTVSVLLIAPAVLAATVYPVSGAVGWALRLAPHLIRRSLLRNRWRSAAIITAVALCVTLVVSAHTQTESLLAGGALPTGFPDLLVVAPDGIERKEVEEAMSSLGVTRWTGFNGFDVQMIGAEPDKTPGLFRLLGRTGNTWFLAVEPGRMDQVTQLDFVQGDPAEVAGKLEAVDPNTHLPLDVVVVTEAFLREHQIRDPVTEPRRDRKLGDTVRLRVASGEKVHFEIVGVVRSLSLQVASEAYKLDELLSRSSAVTVIGSWELAHERFGKGRYSTLLIDVESPEAGDELFAQLGRRWSGTALYHLSLSRLKGQIDADFRRLTRIFSMIGGLLAAAVATVGVANVIGAEVLSRRRELGILHAVGMTRGQLARLILGEAMVVGVAAALLGAAAGVYAARLATRMYGLLLGAPADFTLPIRAVAVTVALAVVATVAAATVAAVRAGRANVLGAMRE